MPQTIKIKPFDLKELNFEEQVIALQTKAYNRFFANGSIISNTDNLQWSGQKTLHLGAFVGNQIVGYNSSTPHNFKFGDSQITGYQSGWAVIDPNFRKRGIFFNLINTAKEILKEQAGAFIFGFPNSNSEPIFTKKLGFSAQNLNRIDLPASNILLSILLKDLKVNYEKTIALIEEEQFQFKRSDRVKTGTPIICEGTKGGILWGKSLQKKKFGLDLKLFSVGGFNTNSTEDMKLLLRNIKSTDRPNFYQMVLHPKDPQLSYFTFFNKKPYPEPFILYDLKGSGITASDPFSFGTGLKDVF